MMDQWISRWPEIRRLLERALEAPTVDRRAILEAEPDAELRAHVESLIAKELALAPAESPRLPEAFGPYRVLGVVGEGGMGSVFLAERADGSFAKRVAIKVIRDAHAQSQLARFRRERDILARMEHPGIARLYDGGLSADGTPWFALEYVEGLNLSAYVERARPGLRQRIELFLKIAEAVRYAHQHLVVHRDLKPANILVDAAGEPRLLDFGIAKLLEEVDTQTASRAPLTVAYAAPEQIRGETITTATDIYALGVVLYELLTGQRPHKPSGPNMLSLMQAITDTDPEAPSRALANQATVTARALRGDLDTICLQCLRRQPAQRYASVDALIEDLRHYLADRPIQARPLGWLERIGKGMRRNKALSAALAALLITILGGAGLTTYWAVQARQEAERATTQALSTEALRQVLTGIFADADPYRTSSTQLSVDTLFRLARVRAESDLAGNRDLYYSVSSDLAHGLFNALDQERGLAWQEELDLAMAKDQGVRDETRLRVALNYEHELIKLGRSDDAAAVRRRFAALKHAVIEGSELWFKYHLSLMRTTQPTPEHVAQVRAMLEHPAVIAHPRWHLLLRQLLAQNLAFTDQEAEANRMYGELIADLRQGGVPMELARVLHNSAWTAEVIDDATLANLEEAIAIYTREVGHDHFQTLNARNILAGERVRRGDAEGVEHEFEAILDGQRPRGGIYVIATLGNYSAYFEGRRDFARALVLIEEAQQGIDQLKRGLDDGMAFGVAVQRARLTLLNGKVEPAATVLGQLEAHAKEPEQRARLDWVQALYQRQVGRCDQALVKLADLETRLPQRRGEIQVLRGECQLAQGDREAALTALRAALSEEAAALPKLEAWPARAQLLLADLLAEQAPAEAEALRQAAHARIEALTPPDDPWREAPSAIL